MDVLYLQDHISNVFLKNKEDVQNWKFVPIQKVSHLEPRGTSPTLRSDNGPSEDFTMIRSKASTTWLGISD